MLLENTFWLLCGAASLASAKNLGNGIRFYANPEFGGDMIALPAEDGVCKLIPTEHQGSMMMMSTMECAVWSDARCQHTEGDKYSPRSKWFRGPNGPSKALDKWLSLRGLNRAELADGWWAQSYMCRSYFNNLNNDVAWKDTP